MGGFSEAGTENTVFVTILLKQHALNLFPGRFGLFHGNSHRHEPNRFSPTERLINATVELDIATFPGPIPASRIKGRLAAFVGEYKSKSFFNRGPDRLPTAKFPIGPDQYLAHTVRQSRPDILEKIRRFFPAKGFSLAQLAAQIFPGLVNEGKHGTIPLLATMFWVMAFAGSLLVPVNRLYGRVDVNMDIGILKPANLPYPIPESGNEIEQRRRLVDSHAVQIPPIRARHRQAHDVEDAAKQRVKSNVEKMPQPVKTDKQ